MGLASSQARLLNLTSRMHQIEYKAAKIEAEKLQMANKSRQVYLEYMNALEQTKIQHKFLNTDGSVTFRDINYYDLMFGQYHPENYSNYTNSFTEGSGSADKLPVTWQYGLFSTENGFMYVPKTIRDAYELCPTAEEFAAMLSDWTPPKDATGLHYDETGIDSDLVNPDNQVNNRLYDLDLETIRDLEGVVIPEPENEDEEPMTLEQALKEEGIHVIGRKSLQKTVTIGANKSDQTLYVQDEVSGVTKKYNISTTGSNVQINILDNGRLYIKGNGATITAENGQADNIILIGKNNTLDTGDENDIVRVNTVRDSEKSYTPTQTNVNNGNYDGNVINTGSGDDYVQNFGHNTIDTENGYDYIWDRQGWADSVNGAEVSFANLNNATDGHYGWSMQNGYGDCQFLSTLNSLNVTGKFNQYINVADNGNGNWTVSFPQAQKTITVKEADFSDNYSVKGDLDIKVIETAMRKLIAEDGISMADSGSNILGNTRNFNLIAKYVFGTSQENQIRAGADKFTTADFTTMLNAYNSKQISNLVVGTKSENASLGIYNGHAYAVKDGAAGQYVNLINPHDSNDVINLEWNDFLKYFGTICLFGDTYDKYINDIKGGDPNSIWYRSSITAPVENSTVFTAGGSATYQYYINLYNAIEEAGGCEIIPENMMYSKKYLTNIINSGMAYIKMFDNKQDKWVGTSVATNTSLQEVTDETGLRKAEAKYEADMRRIDMKDRKFDYDLAALDNERNAIKQEMETLKTVAKDNVERTFKIFS